MTTWAMGNLTAWRLLFFPPFEGSHEANTNTHTHRAVFRMWGLFLAMFRRSTWCAVCPGGSVQLWPGLAGLCRYSDPMCDCLQHCQKTDTTRIKSDLVGMYNECTARVLFFIIYKNKRLVTLSWKHY